MHKKSLILGLLSVCSLSVLTFSAINAKANEPLCHMQTNDGTNVDLSSLCGKKPTPTVSEVEIDPNTPAPIQMVGKKEPSALWKTVPDLPQPPQVGATTNQVAKSNTIAPASPAR